jgi:hypothetical protein
MSNLTAFFFCLLYLIFHLSCIISLCNNAAQRFSSSLPSVDNLACSILTSPILCSTVVLSDSTSSSTGRIASYPNVSWKGINCVVTLNDVLYAQSALET